MLTHITRASLIALLAGLLQLATVAPTSAAAPVGQASVSSPTPGHVAASGIANDPDDLNRQVEIQVNVGATSVNIGKADDLTSQGYYGFNATIPVYEAGDLPYTVYALDLEGGPATVIGQGVITVANTLTGAVEVATSTVHRTIDVSGWAGDSDAPDTPVDIVIYVGGDYGTPGVEAHTLSANIRRPDGKLGFSARLPTAKTGPHQLSIYAMNRPGTAGPDNLVLLRPWVAVYVDATPPQTTITSAPKTATTDDLIHVTFSSNEPNSTFQCRWDEEEWFTCADGTGVKLTAGNHRIAVRATDAAGNLDTSPAVWVVTVTQAPTPTDPNAPTNPGTQTGRSIVAKAVKKKSRLRINVGPDSATTNYRVIVQRKVGKKWRKVARARTRGPQDIVTINLKRGTYRAVLPKGSAGKALRSNTVRLKR